MTLKRRIGPELPGSVVLCGLLLAASPALAKKSLGRKCGNNNECKSGFCDAGWGSSGTSTCVPRRGTGGTDDHCTNNNHCRSGKCVGLKALGGGRWRPGKCAGKKDLGKRCSNNSECKSKFCDRGMGSSNTSTCVPRSGTGATGKYCTNNGHCRSGVCTRRKCAGKKKLGAKCGNNSECKSKFCDRGMGSSGTSTCVPRAGTGATGNHCTNNNHCRSNVCGGLKALGRGRWRPGKCHSGKIVVRGTIVNMRNKPVKDVIVTAWDVNPGKDTNVNLGWKKTDARGNFRFETRAHRDRNGNPFPDIRLTVEVEPKYTYPVPLNRPCWKRTTYTEKGKIKWRKFCWRDINAYFRKQDGHLGPAHYTTKNKRYWKHRSRIVRQVGKRARIAVWPGRNKQLNDHNPSKDVVVARGMIRVPINRWEKVRTTFDPRKNGFSFVNVSRDVCWGPTCKGMWKRIFSTSQALCGGFSLTSLKRYINRKCDTNSLYKRTKDKKLPPKVKEMLVKNQMETFFYVTYVDRGINLGKKFNINALKFLAWQAKQDEPGQQAGHTIGVSTKPEWNKVRHELKARKLPVVIGQIKHRAPAHNLLDINGATNNHQVLAIGYDYNPFYGSVTLYIYDPNHPNRISEIRFNEYLYHSKMFIDYFHGAMEDHPIRGFFMCTKAPPGKRPPPRCR